MTHLVCGPPCSGKSTWVDERFQPGDIVLDYDAIMQSLTRLPTHQSIEAAKQTALRMFWAGLENLPGNTEGQVFDGDIWIVATMAAAHQRVETAKRTGATITLIDPGKAACIERAQQYPDPPTTVQAIESWYERYTAEPDGVRQHCSVPGCDALVTSGRCDRHRQEHERYRGTRYERGYTSQWTRERNAALPAQPTCPDPFGIHTGQVVASAQRDHIVAKQFGGTDDPTNLWFLCVQCHGHKTRIEQTTGRQVVPEAALPHMVQAQREYAF
jgi:5-methylcytosine-specific restriction endonuclease McrA